MPDARGNDVSAGHGPLDLMEPLEPRRLLAAAVELIYAEPEVDVNAVIREVAEIDGHVYVTYRDRRGYGGAHFGLYAAGPDAQPVRLLHDGDPTARGPDLADLDVVGDDLYVAVNHGDFYRVGGPDDLEVVRRAVEFGRYPRSAATTVKDLDGRFLIVGDALDDDGTLTRALLIEDAAGGFRTVFTNDALYLSDAVVAGDKMIVAVSYRDPGVLGFSSVRGLLVADRTAAGDVGDFEFVRFDGVWTDNGISELRPFGSQVFVGTGSYGPRERHARGFLLDPATLAVRPLPDLSGRPLADGWNTSTIPPVVVNDRLLVHAQHGPTSSPTDDYRLYAYGDGGVTVVEGAGRPAEPNRAHQLFALADGRALYISSRANPDGTLDVRRVTTDGTRGGTSVQAAVENHNRAITVGPLATVGRGELRVRDGRAYLVGKSIWRLDLGVATGAVAGVAFADLNRDGARQDFEPAHAGGVFHDVNSDGARDAALDLRVETDAAGAFAVDGLPAGDYAFAASDVGGRAVLGGPAVAAVAGGATTEIALRLGGRGAVIWGRAGLDADRDGVPDAGGPAAEGLQIYLDLDGDGWRTYGEPMTTVAADGTWGFENLAAGTYVVRPAFQTGWLPTNPGRAGGATVTVGEDGVAEAPALAADRAAAGDVRGVIWSDLNANGVIDGQDVPGLPPVPRDVPGGVPGGGPGGGQYPHLDWPTLYLDVDGDDTLDEGEPAISPWHWQQPVRAGFAFADVPAGTYALRLAGGAGLSVTAGELPATVTVGDGADAAVPTILLAGGAGPTYGGSFAGEAFADRDGDGVRGPDEPPVAGVTYWVDADRDGVFTDADPRDVTGLDGRAEVRHFDRHTVRVHVLPPEGRALSTPAFHDARASTGDGQGGPGEPTELPAAGVVPADDQPPFAVAAGFDRERSAVWVRFDRPVIAGGIDVRPAGGGAALPAGDFLVEYADDQRTVRWAYRPGGRVAALPDGLWVARPDDDNIHDATGRTPGVLEPFAFRVLAGDATGDGRVTIEDFTRLRAGFGRTGEPGSLFADGDFDYDGRVTLADFALLRRNFGLDLTQPAAGEELLP